MESRELLESFTAYCREHPHLRFWQALSGWAGMNIFASKSNPNETFTDTFYWTHKGGFK